MEGMILNSTKILEKVEEDSKARELFHTALGIVIVSTVEAGCILSASAGKGLFMVRKKGGTTAQWSPPTAVSVGGLGLGLQLGASVKDLIVFMFDENSCAALAGNLGLKLGLNHGDVAFGGHGRGRNRGLNLGNCDIGGSTAVAFFSKGATFAVVSVDGTLVRVRNDINSEYYNKGDIFAREILLNKKRAAVPGDSELTKLHEKLTLLGRTKTKSVAKEGTEDDTEPEESDEELERHNRSMEKKIQCLDDMLEFKLELALINAREIK